MSGTNDMISKIFSPQKFGDKIGVFYLRFC
jgi:hypothetical protein